MSGGHGHGGGSIEAVAAGDSWLHRLDARAKIIGLLLLVVVAATTPEGAWAVFGVFGAALAVLVALGRLPIPYVARRLVIEIPFIAAALVLVLVRGPVAGATLALRVTISVLAVVVLSSTTPFPDLLRGFERLRAPALLVTIVALMWRYLHVIGEEVRRMKVARQARGDRARTLMAARAGVGGTIAALFIRSLERGERVHLAMLSRGYAGGVPATFASRTTADAIDLAFVAALAVTAIGARITLSP